MTVIAVRRRSGTRVKRSNQMKRFVPAPNAQAEDEGWLLSVVYNRATEKSEVIVVDAMRSTQDQSRESCYHGVYHLAFMVCGYLKNPHRLFVPDNSFILDE